MKYGTPCMMNEQRRYSRNVLQALTYPLMDVRLSIISAGMDITTDIAGNFSLVLPRSGRANTQMHSSKAVLIIHRTRILVPSALLGRRRRRRRTEGVPKKSRSNIPRVIRYLLYARRRLSHYYFIVARIRFFLSLLFFFREIDIR